MDLTFDKSKLVNNQRSEIKKKYTILIVDDEQSNLNALTRILEEEYNIIAARSGFEALNVIALDPNPTWINLIISDQRMPGMTGVEFLKKSARVLPTAIRMLVSAYTDINEMIDIINEGKIYKFISKPIDPQDLLLSVKRSLEAFELELRNVYLIEEQQQMNESLEERVEQRTRELRQTEEMLRKSEKLAVVGQLAAGIAHEIRNPLTTIKGFLQLIGEKMPDKTGYLDIMMSEIESIEWITTQFMSVAKPQKTQFIPLHLDLLIQQMVAFLTPQAILHNIQFKLEMADGMPTIEGEENQLKQLFINLLKNSIEAMDNGGKITITTIWGTDNKVVIRILDQGCGIPADRLPHLGEPFYSLKEKGTGLGLMICFRIIAEHSGNLLIESELGKGTMVEIELPVVAGRN